MSVVHQVLMMAGLRPFVWAAGLVSFPSTANWSGAGYDPASGKFSVSARLANKTAYSTDGGSTWTASAPGSLPEWGVPTGTQTSGTFALASRDGGTAVYGGTPTWNSTAGMPGGNVAIAEILYIPNNTTPKLITIKSTTGTCPSYVSTDSGATWSSSGTLPTPTNPYTSLAGFGTSDSSTSCLVVAVSGGGCSVMNDIVTMNWSSRITLPGSMSGTTYIGSVGTNGGAVPSPKFLVVNSSSTKGATSDDGTNWTAVTLPASANWCKPVWTGNVWLIYAIGSNTAYTSTTAATGSWTSHTLPATLGTGQAVWASDPSARDSNLHGNGPAYKTVIPIHGGSQGILITTG